MNSLICLEYESSRFLFDEIGKKAHPVGKGYKKTTADQRTTLLRPQPLQNIIKIFLECRVRRRNKSWRYNNKVQTSNHHQNSKHHTTLKLSTTRYGVLDK